LRFRILFLIIFGLLIVTGCSQKESAENASIDKVVTVDKYYDSLIVELSGVDSLSVFEILNTSHEVDYVTSSMGIFVRSIDGVAGNTEYFWVFAVNDKVVQTACDKYITGNDDKIKWFYRKIVQ